MEKKQKKSICYFLVLILISTYMLSIPSYNADVDERYLESIRTYYSNYEVEYDEKQDVYNLYCISKEEFISWMRTQDEYEYFDCVEIEEELGNMLVFHHIMDKEYYLQSEWNLRVFPYLKYSCLSGGNHVFVVYGKGYHVLENSVEYLDNDCFGLKDFSFEEVEEKNCSLICIPIRVPYELIGSFSNTLNIHNFDKFLSTEYKDIPVEYYWVYGW